MSTQTAAALERIDETTGEVLTINAGKLAMKIARIAATVKGRVVKDGRNEFHKYNYSSESAILEAVRMAQAEHNVAIFPSVLPESISVHPVGDKGELLTSLVVQFKIQDGDSGEFEICHFPGSGTDKLDKGGYKALTGASKYFLQKLYQLPTGTDPEQASEAERDDRPRPAMRPMGATDAQRFQAAAAPRPVGASSNTAGPRPLGTAPAPPVATPQAATAPASSLAPRPLGAPSTPAPTAAMPSSAPRPLGAPAPAQIPAATAPASAGQISRLLSVEYVGDRQHQRTLVMHKIYRVITTADGTTPLQRLAALDDVGAGLQTCFEHKRDVRLELEQTDKGPKIVGFEAVGL